MTNDQLMTSLTKLNMHYLRINLDDFVAEATKHRYSPQQIVEHLAKRELEEGSRRGVERRLVSAKLGRYRPLADFNWAWPQKIDREAIEELMRLGFVKESANVVLFGPAGVGKTMLAKNIAHSAVMAGHSALCTDAFEMLTDLEQQESPRQLKMRLNKYIRPRVLVIDELGYLSYSTKAADLLFRVITGRYQAGPTILTTNVPFKDWNTVFPTASCLGALIDRLMHRAEVIAIEAESYRKKEAAERKKKDVKTKGESNEKLQ